MTIQQFREWQVYGELEPFDEERDDLRFASVVQMIAEVHRSKKHRARPFTLSDARLRFGDTPAPAPVASTWQQQKAVGMRIAQSFGAVIEVVGAKHD